MENELLTELEQKIGYQFKDKGLLKHAMSHSSYANERHMGKLKSNERLEFLGDAVLELVTSEYLFHTYPTMPEGDATKMRASIVCEQTLAFCAKAIPLGDYILLGRGEEISGGRTRASITSDACEALIGAIYLDGGFTSAKEFVLRFVMNDIEHKKLFFDSKTILQEMVQENGIQPIEYVLTGESGPDHDKQFTVEVHINGVAAGEGTGHTKKAAEQAAAYQAIRKAQKDASPEISGEK